MNIDPLAWFSMGNMLIFGIFVWVGIIFLISALLRWLWNITIPGLFPVREITFWEAFRLLIICSILFGGLGFNFNS